MESEHTPGPWEYLPGDGTIVHQDDPRGFREIAWTDADYRLAAAAPELLAALKAILKNHRHQVSMLANGTWDVDERAMAAIAKAEVSR